MKINEVDAIGTYDIDPKLTDVLDRVYQVEGSVLCAVTWWVKFSEKVGGCCDIRKRAFAGNRLLLMKTKLGGTGVIQFLDVLSGSC